MKSIATRYADTLFRSRLEARWAAFFDLEGIHWEYEPDNGRPGWWPDFNIRGSKRGFDCEVKPVAIDPVHIDPAFMKAVGPNWTILLGRAPSDPIVGVGVRRRVGIETIAMTVEAGNLVAVPAGAPSMGHVSQQFEKTNGLVTQWGKSKSVNDVLEAYYGRGLFDARGAA